MYVIRAPEPDPAGGSFYNYVKGVGISKDVRWSGVQGALPFEDAEEAAHWVYEHELAHIEGIEVVPHPGLGTTQDWEDPLESPDWSPFNQA